MLPQKGFATLLILIAAFLVLTGVGAGGYFYYQSLPKTDKPISQASSPPIVDKLEASSAAAPAKTSMETNPKKDEYNITLVGSTLSGTVLFKDNLPIIITSDKPRVFFCKNLKCDDYSESAVDSVDISGSANINPIPAAITKSDDLIMTFFGVRNGRTGLFVVNCKKLSCSNPYYQYVLGGSFFKGLNPKLAVGANGSPVITYIETRNSRKQLYLLVCTDFVCAAAKEPVLLDTKVERGEIAIGNNGFPVIAYELFSDQGPTGLRVIQCQNAECSDKNTYTHSGADYSLGFPSLAIGKDGFPIISGTATLADLSQVLRIIKCVDEGCKEPPKVINATKGPRDGFDSSIVVTDEGLPIISYRGHPNAVPTNYGDSALFVAKCLTPDCSKSQTNIVDTEKDVQLGENSFIAASQGLYAITYWDRTNNSLKFASLK